MNKLLLGAFLIALSLSAQAKEVKMDSPDGKYQFVLNDEGGRLSYSLDWNGQTAVEKSSLGIFLNSLQSSFIMSISFFLSTK